MNTNDPIYPVYQQLGIGQLAAALASAQAKFGIAELDKVNPHFKSRYASLASIMRAVQPHLGEAGIAIVQCPRTEGKEVVLTTRLIHASGEEIEAELRAPIPGDTRNPVQAMAGTLTYLRRYSLVAMLGVATGEDDDGEESAPSPQPQRQPPSPPRQAPAQPQATEDRGAAMNKLHGVAKDLGVSHDDLKIIAGVASISTLSARELLAFAELMAAQDLGAMRKAWDAMTPDDRISLANAKDWCKQRIDATHAEAAPTPTADPLPETRLAPDTCKGCGAPILWGVKQDNKPVPLNHPETWAVEGEGKGDKRYVVNRSGKLFMQSVWPNTGAAPTVTAYLGHHATCPKADDYRNRPPRQQDEVQQ